MPLRQLHSADGYLYQISGRLEAPPVIYLPGVHGCWTPLDKARPGFADFVRLIEVAYPIKENWLLGDYARGLLHLLDELEIDSAHLVGESFGSLVAWETGLLAPERVRSHILVGGFCSSPPHYRATSAALGLTVLPAFLFGLVVDAYILLKGAAGEIRTVAHVKPYPAVRKPSGQRATANRMRLIQDADFRPRLASIRFPVRYLGGANDTVIPVQREIDTLQHVLPAEACFDSMLIDNAPHAIVASHPEATVTHIVAWIQCLEAGHRRVPPTPPVAHGSGHCNDSVVHDKLPLQDRPTQTTDHCGRPWASRACSVPHTGT